MTNNTTVRLEPNQSQKAILDRMFSVNTYLYNGLITASVNFYRKNGRTITIDEMNELCGTIHSRCPIFIGQSAEVMRQIAQQVIDATARCIENTPNRDERWPDGTYRCHRPRFKKQSRGCTIPYGHLQQFSMHYSDEGDCDGLMLHNVPDYVRFGESYDFEDGIPRKCVLKRKSVFGGFEYLATMIYGEL